MANYDSQPFEQVLQQQGTIDPLPVEAVQPPPVVAEPQVALSPIEQLRAKYAAQDQAIQAATQVPMAQVEAPVQVPFASMGDQRAVEMQTAQAREQQLADAAAEAQFNTEQDLAVQQGQERALAIADQKQADAEHDIDNFTAAEMSKEDQDAEQTMSEVMKDGSLGKKIGLAISVLLGGYAQGLTKSQENPVMSFLEKLDKQVMEKRDLKAKERAALRENALKIVDLQLKKATANTNDTRAKAQIKKLQQETEKIRLDIEKARKLGAANKLGAKVLNPLDLSPKERETLVRLPDGSFVMSPLGKKAADDVRTFMSETGNVVNDLQDLVSFTKDKRFYNPIGKDRARVQTKISTLVGALRLPITGPGPLTDTEREFLVKTIGDPSKFFSLKQNEMSRLNEIQNNINRRVQNSYKQAGVDITTSGPVTQQDRLTSAGITPERRGEIETYLKLKKQAAQGAPVGKDSK